MDIMFSPDNLRVNLASNWNIVTWMVGNDGIALILTRYLALETGIFSQLITNDGLGLILV